MSVFKKMSFGFFLAGISCFLVSYSFANQENSQINSRVNSCSVDFLCVDLKYNHGALKILEFQDGPQAGLRAYDEVFGKGAVWRMFWDWLAQFNVPIWYVGILPHTVQEGQFSHYDKDRLDFDYFLKNIGLYVRDIRTLERDQEFRKACNKQECKNSILSGCKGIILAKDYLPYSTVNQFQKKYPDFIIMNQYSRRASDSKYLTSQLFRGDELEKFRPRSQRFPKEYSPRLAQNIINDFRADYYVIKPINSSRSNGVIMTTKEELDSTLKKILVNKKSKKPRGNGSYRPEKPLTYDYWLSDNNTTFLVEKYEPSQYISVNGKIYDPTVRAICALYNNNGNIVVKVLEAFWKIPPQALSDNGDLTEMHVSKYRSDLGKLAKEDLTIKPDDMVNLKNILSSAMSKAYMNMIITGS